MLRIHANLHYRFIRQMRLVRRSSVAAPVQPAKAAFRRIAVVRRGGAPYAAVHRSREKRHD